MKAGFVSCLILEQIVECPSRSVGSRSDARRSLLLESHADRVELALIAGIFLRDSFWNPLHALKTC